MGIWGKHAAMAMATSPNLFYETWWFLSHYVDEAEHKQANKKKYKPVQNLHPLARQILAQSQPVLRKVQLWQTVPMDKRKANFIV